MLTTTLNKIRAQEPCAYGWEKLLRNLGKTQADDEALLFTTILESNGLEDALWCCRSAPEYSREWRLFAVRCSRAVQHLMQDQRSMAAIDVAERFAWRQAAEDELRTAWAAAWDAAVAASAAAWDAADGARDDAWDAAVAARERRIQDFLDLCNGTAEWAKQPKGEAK